MTAARTVPILLWLGVVTSRASTVDHAPELVGSWPAFEGRIASMAVEGAYAYCGLEQSGLVIFDISRPEAPKVLGSYRQGEAPDVFVRGALAYLVNPFDGLVILDVSDPRQPRRLGSAHHGRNRSAGRSVFVSGNHAYVASNAGGLYVVEVSDPTTPRVVGFFSGAEVPDDVFVDEGVAYVADQTFGLRIFDVTDPTSPLPLGAFPIGLETGSVFVSGTLAYVDHHSGVRVLDVSDPSSPEEVSRLPPCGPVFVSGDLVFSELCPDMGLIVYDMTDPADPKPLGSLDGVSGGPFVVSGSHAYFGGTHDASGQAGLQVIDVSNPALLRWAGVAVTQGLARDVVVAGNHAYVVDGSALLALDVSDPLGPKPVARHLAAGAMTVAASGDHLYIAAAQEGLLVFDVRDPLGPRLAGSYRPMGFADKVVVSGDRAYVKVEIAGVGFGLEVLDVSDPAKPARAGQYPPIIGDMAVADGRLHLLDSEGLQVIDVSNPSMARRLGRHAWSWNEGLIAAAGDRVYLVDNNEFLVLDVSDPAQPRLLGELLEYRGEPTEVSVVDGRAYVTRIDSSSSIFGLEIIDVSDSTRPARIGRHATRGLPGGHFVSGKTAYLAAGQLLILDVSPPANPQRLGAYPAIRFANGVFVAGSHAYVAADTEGLLVLDVGDRTSPRLVGRFDTPGFAVRAFVSGGLAYVADNTNGLVVLDVSDPTTPRLAGAVAWPGFANGIRVSGGHAYVVDTSQMSGLQVIDVSRPDRPQLLGRYEGRLSTDFSVAGGHAIVGGGGGLAILDLSNPSLPQRIGFRPCLVESVFARDGYAYASGFIAEFQVIDVSRPDSPRRTGGYRQEMGVFTHVAVSGSHAYVANPQGAGLEVLDIGDPNDPRRVGGNPALDGYEIQEIFAAEDAVFIAAGARGLVILDAFRDEGGSPSFRRGDSNGDGETNLTDAVYTLNHLFLGGPEPDCLEAADSDDSGAVDVTDPIRVLDHLFQGGPEPEPPGLECGEDPVGSSSLGCRVYSGC